jgi:hypothetical protein
VPGSGRTNDCHWDFIPVGQARPATRDPARRAFTCALDFRGGNSVAKAVAQFQGDRGQGTGIGGWGLGLRGGWWAGTEGVRVGSGSRSDAMRVAVGFSTRKAMPRHAQASRSDAMKRTSRRRLPRSAIMASLRDARPRGASSRPWVENPWLPSRRRYATLGAASGFEDEPPPGTASGTRGFEGGAWMLRGTGGFGGHEPIMEVCVIQNPPQNINIGSCPPKPLAGNRPGQADPIQHRPARRAHRPRPARRGLSAGVSRRRPVEDHRLGHNHRPQEARPLRARHRAASAAGDRQNAGLPGD